MLRKKRGNLRPSQSSLVLHLTPILTLRQITFPYAFLTKAGISGNSAQKMLNGEAVQINFRQLTALCLALNCTPNDLFARRDLQPSEGHQLNQLQDLQAPVVDPKDFYKGKSPEEIRKLGEL
ncbi:helix-turn-helix domain-containing protein [Epilithonimonas sp. UC225_85]|uniref:helix-turn-helix domain-containing protein n=1 Tax=Epilithonimonas sp. UC225_85 TaxID=3350167 RepID=UPI0036D24B96